MISVKNRSLVTFSDYGYLGMIAYWLYAVIRHPAWMFRGSYRGMLDQMVMCKILKEKNDSYVNAVAYGPHHPIA